MTTGTDQLAIRPKEAISGPTFAETQQMAIAVAKGGLFACKTPEQALTLMLLAQAEGLHPIQAMRIYHIIENKPSMRADAMLARFQDRGGIIEWVERTDRSVRAKFSHPSLHPKPLDICWDDAKVEQAGLMRGNHEKYPVAMKSARVISEGVRAVMPGVVTGLYTPEEVEDFRPRQVESKVINESESAKADLANDDQFWNEWIRVCVEERGFSKVTAMNFLNAGLAKNNLSISQCDLQWRRDKLNRLDAGEFDAILRGTPKQDQNAQGTPSESNPANPEATATQKSTGSATPPDSNRGPKAMSDFFPEVTQALAGSQLNPAPEIAAAGIQKWATDRGINSATAKVSVAHQEGLLSAIKAGRFDPVTGAINQAESATVGKA
jgi:hypothetical protein